MLELPDAITFEGLLVLVPNQSLDVRYCVIGEDSVVPFPIWENVPLKQLQTLAHSMPNRVGEVIDNEGWSIMY